MIQRGKVIEKFLNLLLVFLLPTQLALHFWPKFAFVFGIRVDYLAPTLYLTDLLFLFLFAFWIIRSEKDVLWKFIKENRFFITVILLLVGANIVFSSSVFVSFLKWIKLIEVALFVFYVRARKDIFSNKSFTMVFFYSLIFFSLIGIFQVINGGTIGGPLYLLGERNFNITTPGIALGRIQEIVFLRAYSTFPHPNALAGYLVLGTIILLASSSTKLGRKYFPGFIVILVAYIMAFSLSSLVGIIVCIIFYLYYRKRRLSNKILAFSTLTLFGISLFFSILSKPVVENGYNFSQSSSQRLELAQVAGKIISNNFLIGTGLNTFIPNEVKIIGASPHTWLLQPVHNIYLLITSEIGIAGGLLAYYLILKILQTLSIHKYAGYLLAILFILVTGLFDHYWFTLQQNLLLLGLLIGKACHSATELPHGKMVL